MPNHSYTNQDTPFTLLIGGFYQCSPAWDISSGGADQCYKLYYPILGQARLKLKTQDLLLQPGHAYLIPGYQLINHKCADRMDVYWIHFVPKSLSMMMCLSRMEQVYQCDQVSLEYWQPICKAIPDLFEKGPRDLFYRVQAMLLDLTSQFLAWDGACHSLTTDPVFEQLKPAITFMDQHLIENPRLEEIAKVVHLAPNYFHRKFTKTFKVTPFNYMLQRRLDLGRQLLLNTDLTLQNIAHRCGFYCEFHFSKTFKKHYSLSPKHFRKRAIP